MSNSERYQEIIDEILLKAANLLNRKVDLAVLLRINPYNFSPKLFVCVDGTETDISIPTDLVDDIFYFPNGPITTNELAHLLFNEINRNDPVG